MLLDLAPGELGGLARALARLAGVATGGRALQHAFHDSLADAGDAEQVVRHAELPHFGLDPRAPGTAAVAGHVLRFRRDAERGVIDAPQPADLAAFPPPQHDVIGE